MNITVEPGTRPFEHVEQPEDSGPRIHIWHRRWTGWLVPDWLYRVKPGDRALCGLRKREAGRRGGATAGEWCRRCEHLYREGVR